MTERKSDGYNHHIPPSLEKLRDRLLVVDTTVSKICNYKGLVIEGRLPLGK